MWMWEGMPIVRMKKSHSLAQRSIYIQKLTDIVKNGLANTVFAIILRKRFLAMGAASGLSQSFTLVGESLMRLALLMVMFASQAFGADDLEFFESKVRPLLAEQCYSCHSSKAKIVQGGLRLDSRETILRGGHSGPALVAGNPDQSRLIRALRHEDRTPHAALGQVGTRKNRGVRGVDSPWRSMAGGTPLYCEHADFLNSKAKCQEPLGVAADCPQATTRGWKRLAAGRD